MELVSIIDEKIIENKNFIRSLENETEDLEKQKKQAEKTTGIKKWVGNVFESSSGLTDEFSSFARDFKKHLKSVAGSSFDLVEFSRGHFYMSGFFQSKKTKRFVYFSTSDVRYFKDSWFNSILVRTAKDEKDFSGGSNNLCCLIDLRENIEKLTA